MCRSAAGGGKEGEWVGESWSSQREEEAGKKEEEGVTRGVGAGQGPTDRKHSLRREGEVSAVHHRGKPLGTTILG